MCSLCSHTGSVFRRALAWFNALLLPLELLIHLEEGAQHSHFTSGTANYVVCPTEVSGVAPLKTVWELLGQRELGMIGSPTPLQEQNPTHNFSLCPWLCSETLVFDPFEILEAKGVVYVLSMSFTFLNGWGKK